ncbi:MAG: hypothetical protein BM556_14935 [Bacteriovorax sp. MedPE-SWde]|nr:MAG: hypothetical protein BM556_14935 [Bacteriovorax sp. MedPE-SWde]
MKTQFILLSLLSFSLISCVDIPSAEEALESAQESQERDQDQQGGQYGQAMQNNFGNNYFEEDDNYQMSMYGGGYEDERFRLPPRGPQSYGQYSNLGNQYGMATDGSRIICNRNSRGQTQFQFERSPQHFIQQNGNLRMIGVHRDGSPIYGHMINHYDEDPRLDNNGGRFAATEDFPGGIYHYVIKIYID